MLEFTNKLMALKGLATKPTIDGSSHQLVIWSNATMWYVENTDYTCEAHKAGKRVKLKVWAMAAIPVELTHSISIWLIFIPGPIFLLFLDPLGWLTKNTQASRISSLELNIISRQTVNEPAVA